MSQLLTVEDVAAQCKVHPRTIRREIASGKLRSVRVGRSVRVRREDLESYIHPPGDGSEIDWSKWEPFTKDNPLWEIVGAFTSGEPWISSDKYRALFGPDSRD